jgi:mannose-6-phosphate isomerase-like protein (cupin superfamily)
MAMAATAARDFVTRARFARPVDAAAVRRDWQARGFSCEDFVDPPGREWNDFVHDVDELVTVLDGRLRFFMGGKSYELGAGDELLIPKKLSHSVHNIHRGTTRWLFGYARS